MKLLLIGRDDDTRRRFALPNGETLIGRRPDCHIVLDAPAIAPRHARVFSVDGRTIIYGLTAEWPIYVNGDTVNRHVLEHGDDIELAHYTLRCVDEAGTDASGETDADAATGPEAEEEEAAEPPSDGAPFPDTDPAPEPEPPPNTLETGAEDALAAENPLTAEGPPALADVPGDVAVSSANEAPVIVDLPATDTLSLASRSMAGEIVDAPRDEDAATEGGLSDEAPADPLAIAYHLDILSGINQGRRLDLVHPRVVLGFNQQHLVEIVQEDGALVACAIGSEGEALLNGEPMDDRPATLGAGDVLSVQRIELQVQQRLLLDDDRTGT